MNRISVLQAAALCALLAGCENGALTQQGYEPEQPVAYSHALHAGEFKMNCRYCHFGAEQSRHAGVPPAQLCLGCHAQVKKDAPEILKLVQAVNTNTPIEWTKVHRLPDFVWFSHAAHVAPYTGLECQKCHGEVQNMVRVQQDQTMTMGWCLDCHRTISAQQAGRPESPTKLKPPTDCAACHH